MPLPENAPGRSPRCAIGPAAAQALGHRSESWAPNASLPHAPKPQKAKRCPLPKLFAGLAGYGTAQAKRTARPHFPGPAPCRGLRYTSSPGSGFPISNRRTSPKSGPQDPVSESATSAARDLCPGLKRKRAGPGVPTPCRGGPGQHAPRLSPSSRASPGGRTPRAGTCSAGPSGALRLSGGLGAAERRGPDAQWVPPSGRGDSAGPASARPLVWRGPGAECDGGGLAQTRRAPGAC